MKKSVANLLSGALILTAIVSVSCGKDSLADLTLDLTTPAEGGANLTISQGETLEIPFTVGSLEGFTVTAEATCDNDDYTTVVKLDGNGASGTISLTAPEFIFEDASLQITLTINDAANSRTVTKSFEVSSESILENLTVASNCHLVSPGAFIKFAAVKGNSTEKISARKVELVWEDAIGLVDSTFTLTNEEIYVSLAEELQGNAVVAAKDAEGTILWSWHIWVSSEDPTANLMTYTYTPAEGQPQTFHFMDRNVGALTSKLGTADVNGYIYQWGRKDPLPAPTYDGNIKTIYDGNGEELTIACEMVTVENNIENGIKNPTTYYSGKNNSNGNYSWITNNCVKGFNSAASINDLWGGFSKQKSIYDPCPAGYRLPQSAAWYFWSDANITKEPVFREGAGESPAHADQMGKKVTIDGKAFYFPLQGEFSQGESYEGAYGNGYGIPGNNWPCARQWTSQFDATYDGTNKSYFRIPATNVSPSSTSYSGNLALGYSLSIRCIKE